MVIGILFVFLVSIGIFDRLGLYLEFYVLAFLSPLTRMLLVLLLLFTPFIPLAKRYSIPGINFFLTHFERKEDIERFPGKGAFFFTLGIFTTSLFFNESILLASTLILSLGDSLSHLVGRYGNFSHPFNKRKRVEGHIVGGILGGMGALLFVPPFKAFFASFVAIFCEGIYFEERINWILDDNLIIPVISGVIIAFCP